MRVCLLSRISRVPIDCSPPGCSVHGILQARIREWVAMPSSRRYSWPWDRTCVSYVPCISRRFFTLVTPRKPLLQVPGGLGGCSCLSPPPPSSSKLWVLNLHLINEMKLAYFWNSVMPMVSAFKKQINAVHFRTLHLHGAHSKEVIVEMWAMCALARAPLGHLQPPISDLFHLISCIQRFQE